MFAQNRQMRRITFLILAVLITTGAFAQTEPANYITAVNKFKIFFNANQPDSIYKMFGPQMTQALTPDKFKTTATQLRSQLGNLTQATFIKYNAPVASYTAAFQNGSLAMSMSLNNDNKIIGLLFEPSEGLPMRFVWSCFERDCPCPPTVICPQSHPTKTPRLLPVATLAV